MTSCDTNILFYALESRSHGHQACRAFLESHKEDRDFAVCELVLVELYTLLRNPSVCARPLSAEKAVEVIQRFRRHPRWRLVDYPGNLAEGVWRVAADCAARHRIYDARLALTLRHHGITEFVTRNVKDFQVFGFSSVWDPVLDAAGQSGTVLGLLGTDPVGPRPPDSSGP